MLGLSSFQTYRYVVFPQAVRVMLPLVIAELKLLLRSIIVAVVFRRSVFDFLRERLRLRHAPPLAVWLALLAVSYFFIYITPFVRDLTAVFWFGLLGCAIGTAMTYVAERFFGRGEADRG